MENLNSPRISRLKLSRIMNHVVSRIFLDLKSPKDICCGINLWKVVEDDMNEQMDDEMEEEEI